MKTTHTHRGTCQACGATQAVDNSLRLIAKHGYKVAFGYFNGTCYGSGHQPAQLDVTLTHETIKGCTKAAQANDCVAAQLKNAERFPETVERWDATAERIGRGGYKQRGANVQIPYMQGTQDERARALQACIHVQESNARGLRDHVTMLRGHVLPKLGTALMPAKAAPVRFEVGEIVTRHDGQYRLTSEWRSFRGGLSGYRVERVDGTAGNTRYMTCVALRKLRAAA